MSAMIKPLIATFEADAAIAKGQAVKFGTSNKRVTPSAATTDLHIGIAQNAAVNVGDLVEVAVSGGGAKGLANGTIAKGNILGVNANGKLQKLASANDIVVGQAFDDAVSGDIFSLMVGVSQGVVTQS
jgi:Uncharacterized conserved protein (DUF2190)